MGLVTGSALRAREDITGHCLRPTDAVQDSMPISSVRSSGTEACAVRSCSTRFRPVLNLQVYALAVERLSSDCRATCRATAG